MPCVIVSGGEARTNTHIVELLYSVTTSALMMVSSD